MKSNSSKTVLEAKLVKTKPVWLIGDRAYDSDLLDKGLRVKGIELIASIR
jgi:outer membrane usher protein FimD/PapC